MRTEPVLKLPIPVGILSVIERSKQLATWTAVNQHIKPEHWVHEYIIHPGSIVLYVVKQIIMQGYEANKDHIFIFTGFQSKELIISSDLGLRDVDQYSTINITINGADEVDLELNCIKGGGACHLREKVLAKAMLMFILVTDYCKNVDHLCMNISVSW
ncbi:hypothetical protein ARMSODRAFT_1032488 [Armillaria solidipes]|uniref:Ribose-5-phosphate isomerase n=1 Tax=Armillaria solidipes TaxID=1076256 RepID=A0A2H3BP50_9AGAR|nr:hypothetical protein ARMSODRAFT_1032488 [Armillaria solidipes]